MRIIHTLGKAQQEGEGAGHLLLSDKRGTFFAIGSPPQSDFDGLFFNAGQAEHPFKALHAIGLEGTTPDTVINHLSWVERKSGSASERFYLTPHGLIYEVDGFSGNILLTLDCKRLYDESDEGRVYRYGHIEGLKIPGARVSYEKHADGSCSGAQYGVTVDIAMIGLPGARPEVLPKGSWRPVELPYDQLRGMRGTRYVYDALVISVKGPTRMVISYGANRDSADSNLSKTLNRANALIADVKRGAGERDPDDIKLAIASAALDTLVTKLPDKEKRGLGLKRAEQEGIFAGLPWFFQFWARDELICLGALLRQRRFSTAKAAIMRWFEGFGESLQALQSGDARDGVTSIDGPGLLCLRMHQMLTLLGPKMGDQFTQKELKSIRKMVSSLLQELRRRQDHQGFILCEPKDTWMDTDAPGDERGRSGSRIEIQALYLAVLDLAAMLSTMMGDKKEAQELVTQRQAHAQKTKSRFFDKRGRLLDGFFTDGNVDGRTRPNIFLAWYFAQDLLSKDEWRMCFDYALERIWLDWGGLTSLERDDPLFLEHHTGLDNRSYHRGDSWFFVNNIAAMALFSINPHRYEEKINAILDASTHDMLNDGYAGHCSEISDAAARTPRGCWAQAWSAATLVELLLRMQEGA